MLKDIYNARLCSCNYDDINLNRVSLHNKDSRFIVITSRDGYESSFANSYDSLDKCIKWIESCNNPDFWQSCDIYIIDINKMIPVFWGKKKRNYDPSKSTEHHVLYYKFINNKLVQLIPNKK